MHITALKSGELFANYYGGINKVVVDIGGKNINGSLRVFFENLGMKYICVDIEPHTSVDIVVNPGDKLPFEDGSIDLIVSTSSFEHDPCFWITFKEMTRITKLGGFIYVNAPTNGPYHCCPGDNWRFYSDAGQALSYWSSFQFSNELVFPAKVVETFHILPKNDIWLDFVCIWKRVDEKQNDILVSNNIFKNIGILEKMLNDNNFYTIKKC
jgi:SAM-dependent methyltransferase